MVLLWCTSPAVGSGTTSATGIAAPCAEIDPCLEPATDGAREPDLEPTFLNDGGTQSGGSVDGIFSPCNAKSHRYIANTNSSQLSRPSLSISDKAQICANVICGNFDCIRIPLAWTPVKKPLRVRSVVLNSCVYFNLAAPLTTQSDCGDSNVGARCSEIDIERL